MIRWRGLGALIEREIYRFTTVIGQTVVPPIISSFLFIFIFGFALGRAIETMNGVPYLVFIVPGLIALHLIESAYTNASSSLFLSRWSFYIQELLVTPLSYMELVTAIIVGSFARALFTSIGVYVVASFFQPIPIMYPWILFYFLVMVCIIFSSIGILTGLLSEKWEHLAVINNFVITPLTYFGGVFTSLKILPHMLVTFSRFNPFFYIVDGVRFSMLGTSDAPIQISMVLITILAVLFFSGAVYLFKLGFKLRT